MKILWLKSDLLHPVDRGGRIRTYNIVSRIAARHEVLYLALDDGTTAPDARSRAQEYASKVYTVPFRRAPHRSLGFWLGVLGNMFSSVPFALKRYHTKAYAEKAAELINQVDVVVCDFLMPAGNLALPLKVPSVLFQHNVEAEIWRRHTETGRTWLHRWFFGLQWRRMIAIEKAACRQFDRVIAVSEEDRRHFEEHYGVADATAVSTGVDIEKFRPSGMVARTTSNIVFVGSMDWLPNLHGIQHFLSDIWPMIKRSMPEATFTIVGREPPPELRALAETLEGVEVTGRVDDVRPYLEAAALSVVPLYIGGGTRLKIYEAMAMECPVVSTTVGAEGLPLTHQEHVWLADTDDEIAEGIVGLLGNDDTRVQLGRTGAEYVRRNFGWEPVAAEFEAQCEEVVLRQSGVRQGTEA